MNKKAQRVGIGKGRKRLLILLPFALSIALHLLGLWQLNPGREKQKLEAEKSANRASIPIKIHLAKEKKAPPKEEMESKRIVENKLLQTETPEKYEALAEVDHKTGKEQIKVKRILQKEKALSPGRMPAFSKKEASKQNITKREALLEKSSGNTSEPSLLSDAKKKIQKNEKGLRTEKGSNPYASLVLKAKDMMNQDLSEGGYLDSGDDEEGETLDLNTKEFRYIGYFTGLRKAIELAWVYPYDAARRGLQGKVQLRFTIKADGKISRLAVLQTSGHETLDQAIVEAIKVAAPFAPLPKGFNKENLTITGSFNYVLSGVSSY
ncbi:MAG: energy transducer TonB [Oligoflexales bacterium]|nr:energy transducer TonB [Oligoflexales bacterium]